MDELRVLRSNELFTYPSYYCKYPCFLSASQTFEKPEAHFLLCPLKNLPLIVI